MKYIAEVEINTERARRILGLAGYYMDKDATPQEIAEQAMSMGKTYAVETLSLQPTEADANNESAKCPFCQVEGGHILEKSTHIDMTMYVDKGRAPYIMSCKTDDVSYYPKYCPECGRKLV